MTAILSTKKLGAVAGASRSCRAAWLSLGDIFTVRRARSRAPGRTRVAGVVEGRSLLRISLHVCAHTSILSSTRIIFPLPS